MNYGNGAILNDNISLAYSDNVGIYVENGTTLDNVKVYPMIVDLTEMGRDDITSVEQFLNEYPVFNNFVPLTKKYTLNLPLELYKINDIRDTLSIDYKGVTKVERRIGKVDLGTLNWTYTSSQKMFYCLPSNLPTDFKLPNNNSVMAIMISDKYSKRLVNADFLNNTENGIMGTHTYYGLAIRDLNADKPSGYLYYELNTPTTETLETNVVPTYYPQTTIEVNSNIEVPSEIITRIEDV